MATITPDEGLEFTAEKLLNDPDIDDWEMYQVAVGSGSGSLDEGNTQLSNEEYRADKDDSNTSIEDSSVDGRIVVKITVSGGTEIAAGTTITEFGIFAADPADLPADDTEDAKDILLHRELRGGVTLLSGDRKTFEIPYEVDSK